MALFRINIQADASVLFKLLQLKDFEKKLNTLLSLDNYLSPVAKIREIVFSFSVLGEFSLSTKPNKTEYKVKARKLIHHNNLDLKKINKADDLDLQEIFADTFIHFFEEYDNNTINSDKLIVDFIDTFLQN